MPRPRRPPGAGPALTLIALILLPSLLAAAQQQPSPPSPLSPLAATAASGLPHAGKPLAHHVPLVPHDPPKPAKPAKHSPLTPLSAHHERALATKPSSAPALTAVRAHPADSAASGVLAPRARSLRDWEVEELVLLATVDGHLHARDRYTGEEIWELADRPMLETIYNVSDGQASLQDQPFVWIVEPREDGALYVLTPGPYPVLQSLGMTVKQLTNIAPYASDESDLPVVYNVEKKTVMLLIDAASGLVKQSFSPSHSPTTKTKDYSCAPQVKRYFGSHQRQCQGVIDIGQTEYTITIHNKKTNAHLCTIRYAEWAPNSRDRDLQMQYEATMDEHYIYSRFNGEVISYDHKRPRWHQRPLFRQPLPYPVARVFDVARPANDESAEAPLVLLPQPPGPAFSEEKAKHVLLNTTDSGAWYALSEINYPAVTDGAPIAACYNQNDYHNWDGPHFLPEKKNLVGVHLLDHQAERPRFEAIAAPTYEDTDLGPVVSIAPKTSPRQPPTIDPPAEDIIESRSTSLAWMIVLTLIVATSVASWQRPAHVDFIRRYLSKVIHPDSTKEPLFPVPAVAEPKLDVDKEEELTLASAEIVTEKAVEAPIEQSVERPKVELPTLPDVKERKVTFDIPEEEEDELAPLSRATTIEPSPPEDSNPEVTASPLDGSPLKPTSSATSEADSNAPATPKKKKAHRGKRGGRKLNKNLPKDDDEVDRIVDAAKQLEPTPHLHPDEVTMNGDDMQDISNIKRIGKLTIDCDRLLGNGSGGTFVFEGKWNERDVAIKRMLPQYFGLAEQEVKLLQESDLHPNVIRYFDDEKDENFLYIAVELCQASLFDLYRDGRAGDELTENQKQLVNEISVDARRTLYQLANGLNHLHSLRIIHRDIKPQNILIAYPGRNQKHGPRLVISDFGLCKTLPDNVSTLVGTTGNAGTIGWKAPELITQPKELMNGSSTGMSRDSSSSTDPVAQGVKRAVDIFSLGCVFFYVLTGGSHPFDDDEGWMQIREYNIKKEKSNLKQLRLGPDSEEPYHLIRWMIKPHPEDRPTALEVMNHPFFWSEEKRLNFLCDCSDHWEREPRDPPSEHLSILEDFSSDVLGPKRNFLGKLDSNFIASLGKQRKYTGDRMLDLLRALRNKKNHYEDMDDAVKARVGPLPDGYLKYWTMKFPMLLMSCYQAVVECGLAQESRFKPYFEGHVM